MIPNVVKVLLPKIFGGAKEEDALIYLINREVSGSFVFSIDFI